MIIGCLYVAELTIMAAWRTYYAFENRKRNKLQAATGISEEERLVLGAINAELGMTDRSKLLPLVTCQGMQTDPFSVNPYFRYEL